MNEEKILNFHCSLLIFKGCDCPTCQNGEFKCGIGKNCNNCTDVLITCPKCGSPIVKHHANGYVGCSNLLDCNFRKIFDKRKFSDFYDAMG